MYWKSRSSRSYFLIALLVLLPLLGCGKDGGRDYHGRPLVAVEWGAKAGKFGLAVPAEGEIVGPRTFTIDEGGSIHVFDSIKRNIKVFGKNGVFQGSVGKDLPGYSFVVHNGNYYLLDGETIYRYTLSGLPLETYPIARAVNLYEGYGQWMRTDDAGNLYVKSQGKTYQICKDLGRPNAALSEEAQINSERRGSPNRAGTHWFSLAQESAARFRLHLQDKRGNRVTDFPIETSDAFGSIIFLDQDEKGIVYLEAKRIGVDGVVRLEVRRYQGNGRLMQSVELPNRYHTVVYKKVAVDRRGNIYQLQTEKQGVRISVWE